MKRFLFLFVWLGCPVWSQVPCSSSEMFTCYRAGPDRDLLIVSPDEHPQLGNGLTVFPVNGAPWTLSGPIERVATSPRSTAFTLIRKRGGEACFSIFDRDGSLLFERWSETVDQLENGASFSRRGDCVVLSPAHDPPFSYFQLFHLARAELAWIHLPNPLSAMVIIAVDSDTLYLLSGAGSLIQIEEGELAWEQFPRSEPYVDMVVSDNGRYVLAQTESGAFDIYDVFGIPVIGFDPGELNPNLYTGSSQAWVPTFAADALTLRDAENHVFMTVSALDQLTPLIEMIDLDRL